jgi:basic membrane protein A
MSSTIRGASRRTIRRAATLATITALALGTTACAPRSSGGESTTPPSGDATTAKVAQFAIVTPETEADHGWNAMGLAGAQEAADSLGLKLDENANVGYDNTETILSQVAQNDNDFIIAHASGFNTAGSRVAQESDVPVLVVDVGPAVPGKVGVITFEAQQGAYLAGVAAAMTTKTNTLGLVLSAEDINWFLMSGGFVEGARSVNPDIKTVIAYIGPAEYGDSAGGKQVADQVIAAGADVILGMGDGATIGYLQAIETADTPVKYIATIGDVTDAVSDPDVLLTSVLWNFAGAYEQAIKDIDAGTFGEENYTLTVENGGLSLQDTPNMSDEIKSAVDEAKGKIVDGSIDVPTTTTRDEVQALIDGK